MENENHGYSCAVVLLRCPGIGMPNHTAPSLQSAISYHDADRLQIPGIVRRAIIFRRLEYYDSAVRG
jgi:hypothetical protein